jgi:hypothetical protein
MIGSKENISDAPWKKGMLGDEELGNGIPSSKKQRLSMAPGDVDAFIVPRKRTNANHLITPRKPLRKTPLNEQAQATITAQIQLTNLAGIPPNAQETTQQASISPDKVPPQKIPLNDLAQDEDAVVAPIEKPVRRRKSLRRSTRRLTRGTTPEQPPTAPAEVTSANDDSESSAPVAQTTAESINNAFESVPPIFEPPQTLSESPGDVSSSIELQNTATSTEIMEQNSVPTIGQEHVSVKAIEDLVSGLQQGAVLPVKGPPATPKAVAVDVKEASPVQLPDGVPTETSGTTDEQLQNNEIGTVTVIEEELTTRANQTPKYQSLVLSSIELGTETRFVSPTKNAGTPRSRRKTPQRRGSRRSTRSTRANSVPPEDQLAQQTAVTEAPKSEISYSAGSPIRPRFTEMPTVETNKSTHDNMIILDIHTSAKIDKMNDTKSANPSSKQSVDVEVQRQDIESPEHDGIMTTQPPSPTNYSDNVDIMETVIEDISSTAVVNGHPQSLAIAPILDDERSAENSVSKIQKDVTFDVDTATATENQHLSSQLKPLQSEEPAQVDVDPSSEEVREAPVEALEALEPVSIILSAENSLEDTIDEPTEELPETSTPNPSTTALIETISESAPHATFNHDDTDMLRNFLTRVKANKAAKASTSIPKRKRSLPHSPIRLPLGSVDSALSPSSPKSKDEFDVSLPGDYSTKRKRDEAELGDDEATEPKSIRRSGRTKLPVKAAPLAAPSFIPVRRLGQDGDNTVTLRRNEEKELAALTRVNTRKNKGGAQLPVQVLAKQAEEKEDPASRQRALKEVFDEKAQKQKRGKKRKTVVWAEELAQFQTEEGKAVELEREREKEKAAPTEEKKNAVKVGVRSKMTLGMAVNGTPAPKRKMRGRS